MSCNEKWKSIEVPPIGIYKVQQTSLCEFTVFPWSSREKINTNDTKLLGDLSNMGIQINIESGLNAPWLELDLNDKVSCRICR